MKKDLVFIASGGRTGSMFLGKYLSRAIEDCYSEHEPDLFAGLSRLTLRRIRHFGFRHMVIDRCLGRSGIRVLGQKLMLGKMTDQECFARIRKARNRYYNQISEGLIVESYYAWWLFARHINRIWPEAKMAGIIRDPRTWIDSWKRHSPKRRKGASGDGILQPLLEPDSLNDRQWSPLWSDIGQTGRLAWDWSMVYRELQEAQNDSSQVRIFRFEDVFDAESGNRESLIRFISSHAERHYRILDLEIMGSPPVNESANTEYSWRAWPAAEARIVDRICGPLMRLYGYGTEPEWRELLAGESGR